ncbi:WecB/TagA/CpsF family glycosyltransferase [Clostridium sp. BSD9I1]|uniref:WecB/TagA/CpsF family glycosyltransferase n=1 Tax=Clostridium sp. BSD9I1 TaxID=2003589 RepID=UPI001644660C|nr:WecB/TagA/CpsF family glycosyltransferase [Clostridium sp. BSD9I1]
MNKCDILGVKINALSLQEVLERIEQNLNNIKGKYICVCNVHTTVMSYENVSYKNIQSNSYISVPDGKPLALICKRKFKYTDRITGPDLMDEVFKISEEKGYTHYFYGSTEQTLKKLKDNLIKKYPKLKIVGMYSPPFRELKNHEDADIVNNINNLRPDFLWVGLGAPKQEIWMYNHRIIIKSLMIGVGAGFDYFAGNIKRAPKWMQKFSLEWLYRLLQDPKRLWRRYLITNSKFIYYMIRSNKRNTSV